VSRIAGFLLLAACTRARAVSRVDRPIIADKWDCRWSTELVRRVGLADPLE
jgi:hypothetical protein